VCQEWSLTHAFVIFFNILFDFGPFCVGVYILLESSKNTWLLTWMC